MLNFKIIGKVGGITMSYNPLGLDGLEFVEFSSAKPESLEALFKDLGFSFEHEHQKHGVKLYKQGDIHFLINNKPHSFAQSFYNAHGPCVPAMGWRVQDAKKALSVAVQ